MKRLMTMLTAAAAALGLQSVMAAPTGTSLEGLATGDYDTTATTGELDSSQLSGSDSYWVLPGDDSDREFVISNYSGDAYSGTRNQEFPAGNSNYLKVKTTLGKAVTRYVNVDQSAVEIAQDGSYYFDSLVKFTAFDKDKAGAEVLTNDAKLAIWLMASGENENGDFTTTNLMVSAGYLTGGGMSAYGAVPTNYMCSVAGGVNPCDGDWHRVSIKAFDNIYAGESIPGFAICIDGKRVNCGATDTGLNSELLVSRAKSYMLDPDAKQLFPSAVLSAANITSVSLDGDGMVDDMIFTETVPVDEFAETDKFGIVFGTGVTSVTYRRGSDDPVTIYETSELDFIESTSYTIVDWTVDSGYVKGALTASTTADLVGYVYTPSAKDETLTVGAIPATASVVDGTGAPVGDYESLADAMTAIAGSSATGPFTVTLNQDSFDGVEIDADGKDIILDLKGNDITADSVLACGIYLVRGNLMITNSVAASGVVTGDWDPLVDWPAVWADLTAGDLIIAGGTYDGSIYYESTGSEFTIAGGRFLVAANDGTLDGATIPDGYELVEGTGDDAGYYVLNQIQVWTVTYLDPEDGEYSQTESVTNNNYATGPATAPVAPEGYEFDNWYTNVVEDVTNFVNLAEMPITADVTLYAGWKVAGGGLDPASGKTEVEVTAESAAAAETTAKAGITVPAGSGADAAVYANYFKYGVENVGVNTYEVSITGIVETVEASVAESAVQRLTDSTATDIDIPAGLYFRITPSTDLPISGTPTNGLSTGSVTIGKPSGTNQGFYKVELNSTPLN